MATSLELQPTLAAQEVSEWLIQTQTVYDNYYVLLFIFQQAPNANGPSIFDVTQRDADKYVVTPNQQFEEDENISAHPLHGREY